MNACRNRCRRTSRRPDAIASVGRLRPDRKNSTTTSTVAVVPSRLAAVPARGAANPTATAASSPMRNQFLANHAPTRAEPAIATHHSGRTFATHSPDPVTSRAMQIGFNMLLWTPFVTEEHFPLFAPLKETGYDGVELEIFDGTPEHYARVARELDNHGLRRTGVTIIPDQERNILSDDPARRAAGVDHLKWAVDCAAALGAELLCGPFYQPLGQFTGTRAHLRRAAARRRRPPAGSRVRGTGGDSAGGGGAEPLRVLLPQHAGRHRGPRDSASATPTFT